MAFENREIRQINIDSLVGKIVTLRTRRNGRAAIVTKGRLQQLQGADVENRAYQVHRTTYDGIARGRGRLIAQFRLADVTRCDITWTEVNMTADIWARVVI